MPERVCNLIIYVMEPVEDSIENERSLAESYCRGIILTCISVPRNILRNDKRNDVDQ